MCIRDRINAVLIQNVSNGRCNNFTNQSPLKNCTTTAGAVKMASAITTTRAVAALLRASRLMCAIYMTNAMPSPVPINTADDRMWIHFRVR